MKSLSHTFFVVCLLLLGATTLKAQTDQGRQVTIKWYGHSCFLITTPKGTQILTDPIDLGDYHVPPTVTPDVVTVSHNHRDHNAVSTVSGEPVVFYGLAPDQKEPFQEFIPVYEVAGDVAIRNVVSHHHPPSVSPTLNAIFIFEFGSTRIVHLGDLGTTLSEEQLSQIGPVNILMIPVGGKYTITLPQADSVVAQLRPSRAVIPMHYRTEVADFLPNTADDFVGEKENVRRIATNSYSFDPGGSPDQPEYIVFESYSDNEPSGDTAQ
jgi:L-ascorbate metabolism protein UlaG (beta-lactamase superfamily)